MGLSASLSLPDLQNFMENFLIEYLIIIDKASYIHTPIFQWINICWLEHTPHFLEEHICVAESFNHLLVP